MKSEIVFLFSLLIFGIFTATIVASVTDNPISGGGAGATITVGNPSTTTTTSTSTITASSTTTTTTTESQTIVWTTVGDQNYFTTTNSCPPKGSNSYSNTPCPSNVDYCQLSIQGCGTCDTNGNCTVQGTLSPVTVAAGSLATQNSMNCYPLIAIGCTLTEFTSASDSAVTTSSITTTTSTPTTSTSSAPASSPSSNSGSSGGGGGGGGGGAAYTPQVTTTTTSLPTTTTTVLIVKRNDTSTSTSETTSSFPISGLLGLTNQFSPIMIVAVIIVASVIAIPFIKNRNSLSGMNPFRKSYQTFPTRKTKKGKKNTELQLSL